MRYIIHLDIDKYQLKISYKKKIGQNFCYKLIYK